MLGLKLNHGGVYSAYSAPYLYSLGYKIFVQNMQLRLHLVLYNTLAVLPSLVIF